MFKRFNILMAMAFFAVSIASAQSSGREMSVEETYLRDSIEIMIIQETARGDSREQKLIALEYIGEAIGRGNSNVEEIRETLEFLSREGRRIVARENGRVTNNFPDVRRQSAKYLGQIGTEEAKSALIDIIQFENEPMVLQEAIKSLGDIGLNDNNDVVSNITNIVRRFDTLNPDNLIALAAIDAFEKIARKNGGLNYPEAIQLLIRISEGSYIRPVQERARQLLAELRNFGG